MHTASIGVRPPCTHRVVCLLERKANILSLLDKPLHVEVRSPRGTGSVQRVISNGLEGAVDAVERRDFRHLNCRVSTLWSHTAENLPRRVNVASTSLFIYASVSRPLLRQLDERGACKT